MTSRHPWTGITSRSGRATTARCPLIHRLGLVAASRASFYIYNDRSDVDALFEAIERAMEVYG